MFGFKLRHLYILCNVLVNLSSWRQINFL